MKFEKSVEFITSVVLAFLLIISVLTSIELYRRNRDAKIRLIEIVEINTYNIEQNRLLIEELKLRPPITVVNKTTVVKVVESKLKPIPHEVLEQSMLSRAGYKR